MLFRGVPEHCLQLGLQDSQQQLWVGESCCALWLHCQQQVLEYLCGCVGRLAIQRIGRMEGRHQVVRGNIAWKPMKRM
jgi:hypothetical protein